MHSPLLPLSLPRDPAGQVLQCLRARRTGSEPSTLDRPSPSRAHDARCADLERDRRLVDRALAGDEQAIEALVRSVACLPRVLRHQNLRRGSPLSPHDLEDVLQEALLAVWKKLGSYDGRGPLEHWALGFALVEFQKGLERRARRHGRAVELPSEMEPPAPSSGSEVDAERVTQALAGLETHEALILRLKHYQGQTFEEIASQLRFPANTIKTRYYRSLAKLRRALERRSDRSAHEA